MASIVTLDHQRGKHDEDIRILRADGHEVEDSIRTLPELIEKMTDRSYDLALIHPPHDIWRELVSMVQAALGEKDLPPLFVYNWIYKFCERELR